MPDTAIAGKVIWEDVPCPLCGFADEEDILRTRAEGGTVVYRLVRCRRCGMYYLNPRPDEGTISHYYPDNYEDHQVPGITPACGWQRFRSRLERKVLSYRLGYPPQPTPWCDRMLGCLLSPFLRKGGSSLLSLPYVGQGRLLDMGCGSGWFAYRMQERGWKVTAMDVHAESAEKVRKCLGIPVIVGALPHPDIKPGSFDLITLGCVLEHVHRPHDTVAAAATTLSPGGMLAIVVPNINSWGFATYRSSWWPLELPRHLLHFTPATLRALVEAHGLEVQDIRMLGRRSWMRRSMSMALRAGGFPVWPRLLAMAGQLRPIASLITRWTVWTGKADDIFLLAQRPVSGGVSKPAMKSNASAAAA